MKENWEFKSPLHSELWDGWQRTTGDPENCIGLWAREGAPLGMDAPIPPCGIFPEVKIDKGDFENLPELETVKEKKNYSSMYEWEEQAAKDINRYVEKGFAVVRTVEWAQSIFGTGTVSKLACIHKIKDDGTSKTRIIVDLLRSDGNRRARVPERIILPRASDIVDMGDMVKSEDEYRRSLGRLAAVGHFPLRREALRLRHALPPGIQESQIICFTAMLFGFRGAPLIMGRLSAALARMWQALIAPGQGALQLYVGDALIVYCKGRRGREMKR